jgi:hypothetical protein
LVRARLPVELAVFISVIRGIDHHKIARHEVPHHGLGRKRHWLAASLHAHEKGPVTFPNRKESAKLIIPLRFFTPNPHPLA